MIDERIKIYFRKHQLQYEGVDVVVNCAVNGSAEYINGTIPNNVWVDVTEFTQGLDKLNLSWSASKTTTDTQRQEGSNYEKGISLSLIFFGEAFEFVNDWLLEDYCGIINGIDVLLVDSLCDQRFRIFELKSDNITYRPFDDPCMIEVALRESDPVWHCVSKNAIFDNWQHWFEKDSTKNHPCFLTCIQSPVRILSSVRTGLSIALSTVPIAAWFVSENNNVFRRILGTDNFVDSPLVRDYILNICMKCGIDVDTMFDDKPGNDYRNLCVFYPSNGQMHKNDGVNVLSPHLYYNFENRWLIVLSDFLDQLKDVFNAEWYVTPNSRLIFQPIEYFKELSPIYDFTTIDAMEFFDLSYSFNGIKKAAYGRYQYTVDGSDFASQEIATLYNDIVDYDGPANNPMLEGSVTKSFNFSPTAFIKDGRDENNYLRETISDGETVAYISVISLSLVVAVLVAGTISAPWGAAIAALIGLWVSAIAKKSRDLRDEFDSELYWGAVRIKANQINSPRLLLWDGKKIDRAKVVKVAPEEIEVNPYYNSDNKSYSDLGKFNYEPAGVYNYPMYFDSFFKDNMYDRFHDATDNPLFSLESHQNFELNVDLCCNALNIFGLDEGQYAAIGRIIKIESRNNYDVFGRIENIEVSYEDNKIILKGKVLRREN